MKDNLKTLFPACVSYDGKLYCITHVEHCMKKIDIEEGIVDYVDNPIGFNPRKWCGADKIFYSDGKIYLFEEYEKKIIEYAILEKKTRSFKLDCNIGLNDNIAACAIWEEKIFVFLYSEMKVIKINLQSGGEEYKEYAYVPRADVLSKEKSNYRFGEIVIPSRLISCGIQIRNKMWIFTERTQYVFCYDLSMDRIDVFFLPGEIQSCIHSIWKNGCFYILNASGNIYSWNPWNNKMEILWDCKKKYMYPYFFKIIVTNKNIWILPCYGNDIFILDIETGKKEVYDDYPKDFYYGGKIDRSRYYEYCRDEHNYYLAMHSANYILIIEESSGKAKWLKPIEPNVSKKIRYFFMNYEGLVYESEFRLKELIKVERYYNQERSDCNSRGYLIWKNVQ